MNAKHDSVNRPSHYTGQKLECIEVTKHLSFLLGNAVKYVWRFQGKNGNEDLEKAKWYLKRQLNDYSAAGNLPYSKAAELLAALSGLDFLPDQAQAISCILLVATGGNTRSLEQAVRHIEALQRYLEEPVEKRYPTDKLPTTSEAVWRDPDTDPPPSGIKLNLLTAYGIAQYGTFQAGYHIGWNYCLKVPAGIKRKMKRG